jgi:hypothetical protein
MALLALWSYNTLAVHLPVGTTGQGDLGTLVPVFLSPATRHLQISPFHFFFRVIC